MSEWKKCKLGDQINLKRGYDLPSRLRQDGVIPIYSSSGITGFHSEQMCEGLGVITGRYGTIGQIFFSKTQYWPLNTTLYIQDFKGNDELFFYYFLQQLDWDKYSDKSAVPGINRNDVHQEDISLPPLPEQKAIAAILSSLDDKIDLLHRQNKTLESIAETLFRQWFVENVGEGESDRKEGCLGNLVDFNYGKTLKDNERSGSGYPVVGSSGIIGFHKNFLVKAPGIVTGRKGTLGVINYMFENFSPIDTTFYITSKTQSEGLFHEYFLLKSVGLGEMNSDSAVPGLNRNAAQEIPINISPNALTKRFNDHCKDTFSKINTNRTQIQTLEKLRDTLLPKLMSGEVRVEI
jgi:type I restriction enzyme, S subunit